MIATKEYMQELCNKFDVVVYTANEATTEMFIQWYNDHKHKYAGDIELCRFELEYVLDYFDKDLLSLDEGDGEE